MHTPQHPIRSTDAASETERPGLNRTGGPGIGWTAALTWLLGFVAVVYLGLKGGGYDPLVHDQIGIAAWWLLAGAVVVGALPRRWPGLLGWCALGLLAAFLAWTAASLIWTESSERTFADVARIAGYAGFFALALFGRESGGARRMVTATGCGIGVIAAVALLSRLHPSWFPAATTQTATFLPGAQERLAYPIDYWNGLAGLIAIGIPLLLQMSVDARAAVVRVLAAAALPAMALTIYFTLSRGGIGAAIVALVVFFAFSPNRIPKLANAAVAAAGGAVLIAFASSRDSLVHGLVDATAKHQGSEVLLLTLAVCAVVGLLRLGTVLLAQRLERPRWTLVSKRDARIAVGTAAAVAVVVAVAVGAPARGADAWSEFRHSTHPVGGSERLGSVAGESRYAIWSSAVREMRSEPLTGTGSGTFEYWWNRDGTVAETVIDTHSLYLQTLGELGIVGFLLIAGFLLTILIGGGIVAARVASERRTALAAALAGCVAFAVSAGFDWLWQIPVLAVSALLLAAVLVTAPDSDPDPGHSAALPLWARAATAVGALVVIAVIAVPLASTSLLRSSQAAAREGRLADALADARTATNVESFAASPHLQQALVLERSGELDAAAEEAREAVSAEETNWKNWLVLSRIEARRENAVAAVADYRKAKSLNPRSPLFSP